MNLWFCADILGFIGVVCFVSIGIYRSIESRRIAKLMKRPRESAAVAQPVGEPVQPAAPLNGAAKPQGGANRPAGELRAMVLWRRVSRLPSSLVCSFGPPCIAMIIWTSELAGPFRLESTALQGSAEILYPSGWQAPSAERSNAQTARDLTDEELKKLDGDAQLELSRWLNLTLYNGTSLKVQEITVEIVVTYPGRAHPRDSRPQAWSTGRKTWVEKKRVADRTG